MKRVLSFVLVIGLVMAMPALAQWEPDVRLTSNSAESRYLSMAAQGSNVHVVWQDERDGNFEIYYKRSTDSGASWGADTRLTNNDSLSLFPRVAVSGSNVHVVWHDYRDGNYEIYYKCSPDSGVSWGADTRLTNDSAFSYESSVTASGSNVHVVWWDNRDGNYEIYYKRSTDSGVSWGADTRLTNNSAGSYYPSAAASGSNVHVIWEDSRDGNTEIYYKCSPDSGLSWGADTRVSYNSADSWVPSVAASGSNLHVVWQDERDGNFEIYYKRSTDSGITWGTDTRLTYNGAQSYNPWVAASGSNLHVVWYDTRDGNSEIYYKRNPTGNVGVEFSPPHTSRLTPYVVFPNPFTYLTTLPGHEAERFSLYDISGRKVGTFRGDRVGEGLAPGVYFLRSSDSQDKPLRIVKVR
jgi:hypothetical protein